jgi:NADH-ubiquinone oxidoreductase chain 5
LKRITGLLIMSIIGGRLLSWLIFPIPYFIFLPLNLKILTLEICIVGGILGAIISLLKNFKLYFFKIRNFIIFFLRIIWFIPLISSLGIIKLSLNIGLKLFMIVDQGWSENFGGQIIYKNIHFCSLFLQKLYLNNIKIYLLFFLLWVIILLFVNLNFI